MSQEYIWKPSSETELEEGEIRNGESLIRALEEGVSPWMYWNVQLENSQKVPARCNLCNCDISFGTEIQHNAGVKHKFMTTAQEACVNVRKRCANGSDPATETKYLVHLTNQIRGSPYSRPNFGPFGRRW